MPIFEEVKTERPTVQPSRIIRRYSTPREVPSWDSHEVVIKLSTMVARFQASYSRPTPQRASSSVI
ncbi:MAG: hypothetical protein QM785_07490 [Pyrinomonadaceae bacterium]